VSAFAQPALYTFGNLGRNTLYGPGRWNWDTSLLKNIPLSESVRLVFHADALNVFNHPQFGQPASTIGSGQPGRITSIVGNPRLLQLALRLEF